MRARSVDGESWETQVGSGMLDLDSEMAPPDTLRALALGDGYVIAVGGGGNFFNGNAMVMRSDDGGMSWQEDLLAMPDGFQPHKLYGVAYSIDSVGDIYLTDRLPHAAVTPEEIDRILGAVLSYADDHFNTMLEIGFGTSIRREWAWRVKRGESLRNLEAFAAFADPAAAADPTAQQPRGNGGE